MTKYPSFKICSVFILLVAFNFCLAQNKPRTINLVRSSFEASKVKKITSANADHALRIANYLFNSKEFQDSLSKRDFTYHNICNGCDSNKEKDKPRILGSEVLDKLFQKQEAKLTLILLKVGTPPIFGKCFGLGFTCPNTDKITSYYKNINCDMSKELPFDYAYGVHLCHEYMHNIGYCHTDHIDDVAEATGWIAFYFINKWYKEGTRIP
jgi:hypothetical protein